MKLNQNYDYYFQTAKLVTNLVEVSQEFSYIYEPIENPSNSEIFNYFEFDTKRNIYIPTTDSSVVSGKTYYGQYVDLDENGEPVITEKETVTKLEISFKYKVVDPSDQSKIMVLENVWGKKQGLIIKTDDNISPKKYVPNTPEKMTDRILIDNKFYTVSEIYKELKNTSNTMFSNPEFTTYLLIEG